MSSEAGQPFCDLIAGSYNGHIAKLDDLKDRASLAAAVAPSQLGAVLRDGVAQALDRFGTRLSPRTTALIESWLQQHLRNADALLEPWNELASGSSNELVRGFKAGFSSAEAKVGTALGSLLGGVGGFAGGLVGTFLAMQREDAAHLAKVQGYLGQVDRWFTAAAADFDDRVLPKIERDLNPINFRMRWIIGVALAAVAAGFATWLAT